MKLLTWNITHGGSGRIEGIIRTLVQHNPDLIVLTEYRAEPGDPIGNGLRNNGWIYQISSHPPPDNNGILLASRFPLESKAVETDHPLVRCRWVEARVPGHDLTVVGLHIPTAKNKPAKRAFWEHLIAFARTHLNEPCILMGDFNTGLPLDAAGSPFVYSEYMRELSGLGWVDAWRRIHGPEKREFTWYSTAKKGFRLDYGFLSPEMVGRLKDARHLHECREQKISDHSPLLVEIY